MQACSDLPYCSVLNGSVPCSYAADPDVSGTGILLSFVISGAVAFIIAALGLLFTTAELSPDVTEEQQKRLFLGALNDTRQPWMVDLDHIFYTDFARLVRPLRRTLTWRRKLLTRQAVQTVALILSDQAQISGVAILTVALATRTTITEYHYAIIATLATIAFTVLQSATLLLNGYFSDNVFRGAWRAVVATVFTVLLLINVVMQGHAHWLDSFGTPVQCIYNTLGSQYTRDPAVIVSILLQCILLYTGWLQCVRVLAPTIFRLGWLIKLMAFLTRVLTCALPAFKAVSTRVKASQGATRVFWTAFRLMLLPAVLATILFGSVIHSKLFDMIRICVLLVLSSVSVFALRTYAFDEGQQGDDTAWGFGQALAVFMLALPLFNAVEVWSDELHIKEGHTSQPASLSLTETKPLDYSSRIRRASRTSENACPIREHSPMLASTLPRSYTNDPPSTSAQDFGSVTSHFTFRLALYSLLIVTLMAGIFIVVITARAANGTD